MSFFSIKHDEKIKNPIKIEGFNSNRRVVFSKEELEQINDMTTLYFECGEDGVMQDFYTYPIYLVSAKMKKVIQSYEENVIFKPCSLTNITHDMHEMYYLMIVSKIDCISDKTEYSHDRIKKLVIDGQKTKDRRIFEISTRLNTYLIVTLDLAESILRRDAQGLIWDEIEFV